MDLNALDIVIPAVITGLVTIATRLKMPRDYAPLMAVVLGVAAGVIYLVPDDPKLGVLAGLVVGLSSVGLYSAATHYKERLS